MEVFMKKIIIVVLLFHVVSISFCQTNNMIGVWKDWKNDNEHDGHSRYYVVTEDIIYISESLYDDGMAFPQDIFFGNKFLDENTMIMGTNTILYRVITNKTTEESIIGCFVNGGKNSIVFDKDGRFKIEEHYFNDSLTDVNIIEGSYSLHDNFIILKKSNNVYIFYVIGNENILCILGPTRLLLKLFYYLGEDYYKLIK
jgi:hypothetical protein